MRFGEIRGTLTDAQIRPVKNTTGPITAAATKAVANPPKNNPMPINIISQLIPIAFFLFEIVCSETAISIMAFFRTIKATST